MEKVTENFKSCLFWLYNLVRKHERKSPLDSPSRTWEDNIKMGLR